MKAITPTINGLASSLFLNVGLVNLAQRLDPVSQSKEAMLNVVPNGGVSATIPCNFSAKPSR